MLYAIPVGLVLGLAMGGRPERLAELHFRLVPVLLAGLLVQVALFSPAVTERIGDLGPPLYVISTLVVLAGVAANWRIPGVLLVVGGATCNLTAIVSNGGYMPAGAGALAALGRVLGTEYSNSAALSHPNLELLTDIFAMPRWVPFANIFSVGDVLIGIGVAVVLAAAMRRPSSVHAPGPEAASAA
jgi:hypothetical protein